MGTTTLRPNGIVIDDANWGNAGPVPAANKQTAMADNTDNSYIQTPGTGLAGDGTAQYPYDIRFDMTTFAFPALSQIRYIQCRLRMQNTSIIGDKGFLFGIAQPGVGTIRDLYLATGAGFSTISGSVRTVDAAAAPWTQAAIDSIQFDLTAYYRYFGTQSPYWAAVEAYMDVVYNEAPVATVTAPTEGGSVTTTTRPTVTWTYADPEGDAQERYRVKIFTAAQYGIGGFDPETSPNTWDSGEVFSSLLSLVVPIDLANSTTYRAYVKVADVGSGGRYSNWDSNTFTINVTAPPAPGLTVTAQASNATGPRTKLDIVRTANATPTTWMAIEYSDDGGTTWGLVRGAEHIVNNPDGTTFTIYDHEATPRLQRSYRAKSVRTV